MKQFDIVLKDGVKYKLLSKDGEVVDEKGVVIKNWVDSDCVFILRSQKGKFIFFQKIDLISGQERIISIDRRKILDIEAPSDIILKTTA